MLLNRRSFVKLACAGTAAATVLGTGSFALADAAPAAEPARNLSDPAYDFQAEYFFSDYNALSNADADRQDGIDTFEDTDIVFKALYYDELIYLLEQPGDYLIFLGGSWCHNTRAAIGSVNAYAKAHGIKTVYNFDFRLDGATRETHVRESAETPEFGGEKVVSADWNYLYGELIDRYFTNLNDWVEYKEDTDSALTWYDEEYTPETVAKVQVPFLFIYNKDNAVRYVPVYDENGKQTGVEVDESAPAGTYPIVYGFEEMVDRDSQGVYVADEEDETKRVYITDDYEARLEALFDFADEQKIEFATYTDAQYIYDAFVAGNGRGHADKLFDVFEPDEQVNVEVINYRQAQWLLQQEGSSVIVFAGAWCANSQASLGPINDYAVADGVKVYFFDFRLDGKYPIDFWGYDRDRQFFIRSSVQEEPTYGVDAAASTYVGQNNPFAYLYTEFVNTYLTNVETVTDPESDRYWITYTTDEGEQDKAPKLQQPYLLAYNKDALDEDGFVAPVIGWYEEMLEITDDSINKKGTYIYQVDNYESYTSGIEGVLQAFDQSTGRAFTAYDGEPRHELIEEFPEAAEDDEKPEEKADEKEAAPQA
jgi:hypothetical protein